jgi:Tle cognate immunity protein 4 C-terminal domain/Tle cognate immunity protein 4 N-terminal domain
MSQDNLPKKTVCLGRYLIDLPSDAALKAGFTYAGGLIETRRNVTQSMFEKLVSNRESSLKSTPHKLGGSLLVGRTDLDARKILLQSWVDATTTQNIHKNETFIYLQDKLTLFLRNTESDAIAQPRTIERAKIIASDYRYRDENEIPTGVGFCINSGFLASKAPNREKYSAAIDLKQFPSVSMSVDSYVTGTPTEGLIERSNSAIASMSAPVLAGMTILRKAARNIGPVKGEEVLIRGNEGSKRSYEFNWKSEGQTNSVEFPAMSIRLATADKKKDGSVIDAPFKTDKEALELWDSLLNTLRLRPGAV